MTSQIPFTPITPEALARLTTIERLTFQTSAGLVAAGQKPSLESVVILLEIIQRLLAEPAELTAEGAGPLLDPDCRAGKCGSCIGPPCEHECHYGNDEEGPQS
jgi:hypothetical protein